MTTLEYMVSAHRAHDDSGFNKVLTARETGTGAYYFQAPQFGCGRDSADPAGAIREVLESNGYRVNRIRPVESAPVPAVAAEYPAGTKWAKVETFHDGGSLYRAECNGWHIWAFRQEAGAWSYGTAGRTSGAHVGATLRDGSRGRDVPSTMGADRVHVAKRAAVALALALPEDARPVRILVAGEVAERWREELPPGCRSYVVSYWTPAVPPAPGSDEWKRKHGLDLFAPETALAEVAPAPAPPAAEIEPGAFYRLPVILPPAAADDMPNAADSIWSDAIPAEMVDSVNWRLAARGMAPMSDSEINRIHAPWKAGEVSADVLAGTVANDRREYELATDSAAEAGAEFLADPEPSHGSALAYAPRTHVVTVYARARGCSAEMVAQHVAATKPDAYAMARNAGHILGARLPDGREINRRAYRFNR